MKYILQKKIIQKIILNFILFIIFGVGHLKTFYFNHWLKKIVAFQSELQLLAIGIVVIKELNKFLKNFGKVELVIFQQLELDQI